MINILKPKMIDIAANLNIIKEQILTACSKRSTVSQSLYENFQLCIYIFADNSYNLGAVIFNTSIGRS